MDENATTDQTPKQPDGSPQPLTPAEIAWVCHEANRAYCELNHDHTQQTWQYAPTWQRASAVNGVTYALGHPTATPKDQHDAWMKEKLAQGWVYGPEKNSDADPPTHPCLVPYFDLPIFQQRKDRLFRAIVTALSA